MFSANSEQVCAGDLGNDAEHLEHRLSEITSLAHKWKAVILLDEADVYLEQRSLQDIRRNGLVSVFLRHLEYFQGIMFLTTNRVTTFDDAFQSRIHFAMKFGDLSTQAKKKIWNNFLEKVPPTEKSIKDKEVDGLSTKNINGRQVRLHPK
jgi:AAA+ superfamily predicted ATPase